MHVHFALKADLYFSNELGPDARSAVDVAVKEANGQVFCKGVPKGVPPEEVGRITRWEADGNRLRLELESGGYTRVHDALFRFRKHIGADLPGEGDVCLQREVHVHTSSAMARFMR